MRAVGLSFIVLSAVATAAPPRPSRVYDLQDVNWRVRLNPEAYAIEGTVINSVKLLAETRTLTFDCVKLTVDSVEVTGKPVQFSNDGKTLTVNLAELNSVGKDLKVAIRYHGTPEAGIYFIDARHASPAKTPIVYTQGEMEDNRNWLPTYDYPDDKATSEGTIEVPAGWSTLSNGKLLGHTQSGGREIFHWKMTQPHSTYLISLVAGPYTEIPDQGASVPVYAFVPKGLEEWGKVAFGGTAENVAFYEKLTHVKYPWPKYSQSAVSDFMFGGMENVSCTTQTIDTLHPASLDGLRSSRGLVAHELAHQWFGDLITANDWSHIWVNEGWATFLPPFFTREKEGKDAFDLERLGIFGGGLEAHSNTTRPMVWNGYQDAIDMFDNFAYPGGASRMFMLMHQVGEEKFWQATAKYLNEYRYKNVTTEQFFDSYSKSLGVNLDQFRKQWFYTSAAPHLTLAKDGAHWVVRQPNPAFNLTLEYMAWKDGHATFKSQAIDGSSTVINSDADAIILDPAVWIMGNIDYDVRYTPDQWKQLFVALPNVAGKQRIADEFFSNLPPAEASALFNAEPSVVLQEKLVERLRDQALVLSLTESQDVRIRSAAVRRLGQLPQSPAAIDRLRVIAKTDNDDVALSATKGLVSFTKDPALLEAAWNRDSFHEEFRKYALDHWARTDPNRGRQISLQILHGEYPEELRVSAIEHLGRLKDQPGENAVLQTLEAVLSEHTFGARTAAIRALGSYGNRDAAKLIRPFSSHALSFFRDAAEEALKQLGV